MQGVSVSGEEGIEITDAALGAYGRLLRAIGRIITTKATADGGLICEDRTVPARPVLWRISSDGTVVADSRYDFASGAFVSELPAIVSRPRLLGEPAS